MNAELGRNQVTLGIYGCKSKEEDIFVLDMEGTDSQERVSKDDNTVFLKFKSRLSKENYHYLVIILL
jgi:hypothetical protein